MCLCRQPLSEGLSRLAEESRPNTVSLTLFPRVLSASSLADTRSCITISTVVDYNHASFSTTLSSPVTGINVEIVRQDVNSKRATFRFVLTPMTQAGNRNST